MKNADKISTPPSRCQFPVNDCSGKTFEQLTVISFAGRDRRWAGYWLCRCVCGVMLYIQQYRLGRTKSCGCRRAIVSREKATSHGMRGARPYKTWYNLLQRCKNPNLPGFKNYGGRGITSPEKWATFEGFWEDMKEGYADDLFIERIDNDAPYSKDNCRWATRTEQNNNRRMNRRITIDGTTKNLIEWLKFYGISKKTFYYRMKMGLSEIEALSTPKRKKGGLKASRDTISE